MKELDPNWIVSKGRPVNSYSSTFEHAPALTYNSRVFCGRAAVHLASVAMSVTPSLASTTPVYEGTPMKKPNFALESKSNTVQLSTPLKESVTETDVVFVTKYQLTPILQTG